MVTSFQKAANVSLNCMDDAVALSSPVAELNSFEAVLKALEATLNSLDEVLRSLVAAALMNSGKEDAKTGADALTEVVAENSWLTSPKAAFMDMALALSNVDLYA